jgi:hypothetical protein
VPAQPQNNAVIRNNIINSFFIIHHLNDFYRLIYRIISINSMIYG